MRPPESRRESAEGGRSRDSEGVRRKDKWLIKNVENEKVYEADIWNLTMNNTDFANLTRGGCPLCGLVMENEITQLILDSMLRVGVTSDDVHRIHLMPEHAQADKLREIELLGRERMIYDEQSANPGERTRIVKREGIYHVEKPENLISRPFEHPATKDIGSTLLGATSTAMKSVTVEDVRKARNRRSRKSSQSSSGSSIISRGGTRRKRIAARSILPSDAMALLNQLSAERMTIIDKLDEIASTLNRLLISRPRFLASENVIKDDKTQIREDHLAMTGTSREARDEIVRKASVDIHSIIDLIKEGEGKLTIKPVKLVVARDACVSTNDTLRASVHESVSSGASSNAHNPRNRTGFARSGLHDSRSGTSSIAFQGSPDRTRESTDNSVPKNTEEADENRRCSSSSGVNTLRSAASKNESSKDEIEELLNRARSGRKSKKTGARKAGIDQKDERSK